MASSHQVSVIIPVYNGERYLSRAIHSVREQTVQPVEIVVVDDGSTDGTAKVASRLGDDIRYVYQENQGPAAARNRGITSARGDVIAFLDTDDTWPLYKLEIQLARLDRDPDVEVVLGRIQWTGMLSAVEGLMRFEGPDHTMIYVNMGSGVYRRSVFDKVGLFDESLRRYEDHDWFLRAREKDTKIVILKEITLHYHLHEHNMSHNRSKDDPTMIQVLKKSLDRRRQSGDTAALLPKFFDYDEGSL